MSREKAFWITSDLYDSKNKLKPHLQQKKYMAEIVQKNGDVEYVFYDRDIDLQIAATGFGFEIIDVEEVPQ